MSLSPEKQAELQTLLQHLSDDSLSPEGAQRLNDLLHGDPAACEFYLDHLTLEAHLRSEIGGQKPAADVLPAFARGDAVPATSTIPMTPPRRAFGAGLRFAAAAAIGALLMLGSMLWLSSENPPETRIDGQQAEQRPNADCVATLLFADNCQWASGSKLIEGQRLPVGALQLERGLVVMRFDGGAAVVMEGPTELELVSRGFVRLTSGRLTVRAPDEAAGFTVRTPASDVVDLGTEFAVVVERGGATEVHVLEGEVTYAKPDTLPENAELLRAGKAVRFDQARESEPRVVPLNAPRFIDLLHKAHIGPREDLLLVHEGFDYPLGRLPLEQANGGLGWGGPWRLSPGNKRTATPRDDLTIAFGKLNVTWPVQGGRGPMLEATPEYQSRTRPLAEPIRLDEDGVYYVSVLVRWQVPDPEEKATPLPAVRLVLRSSENFNGDRVMFNLPVSHRPQIDMRSGAIFTSQKTVPRNGTQFWVGKIVARRVGEDEVFFRVYSDGEPLDSIEPATWSVRSRGVHSDAQLDLLLLSKFGGGACWWDEVRIGKSWRAVVPTAALAKKP
jgi:ferric-dicitrate binding protein FerR (iron transport regulator)